MLTDKNILLIYGPTAVGKTELSLRLAEERRTEIVSVDSMQVYRGLDIGSAKPTLEERTRVPHYLIDVADPSEDFSVGSFCDLAGPILRRAVEEDRPLILCGGTGLYVKSLIDGLAEVPPPNPAFRTEMEAEANRLGLDLLHQHLAEIDPPAAFRIHPHDRKRIIRALEIHHATGVTKTEFEASQFRPPWRDRVKWIGLRREWEDLDWRIHNRVDRMFEAGFLDEVRGLLVQGCTVNHTAMKGLGYREVIAHLGGEETLDRTVELIKRNTRRFARRQMGWFRNDPRMVWVDACATSAMDLWGMGSAHE